MDENRPSLLLKANRQIAEVRDELVRVDVRVDEVVAKNAGYLEEIAKLDSEVTRICARAALSEQRLAEMFDEKRRSQELREEQEVAESRALAERRASLVATKQALERLTAENAAKAEASQEREASDAAKRKRMAAEIKALEAKDSAHKSEDESSRRRVEKLKDELSAERRLAEELQRKLRQAAEAHDHSRESQQTLKDTITSKGGDPAVDVAGVDDASKESEIQGLRTEMASAEESIRKLRASLTEDADRCSQDVASLNNALDGARSELERTMAKAAEVQRDEAAQLEAQVQAERQRIDREETEEASAAQRATRLKGTLLELRERPRRAPTLQDDNTKLVTEQLRKIRDEVALVEVQCQASQDEVHRLERQRLATEAEGAREAQQVKAKIQELWRSLAAATAGE